MSMTHDRAIPTTALKIPMPLGATPLPKGNPMNAHELLKTRMYLVKNGVPYDVVMGMEEPEMQAMVIAFGELDGQVWDWERSEWKRDVELQSIVHMDGKKVADIGLEASRWPTSKRRLLSTPPDEQQYAGVVPPQSRIMALDLIRYAAEHECWQHLPEHLIALRARG